ncbi:hypothetical protein POD19_11270 [Micrococcus sp. GPGPB33]|uniref:DUF2017 family protein n=1 Tax=Micrococcus sp. GPGPB33 TaxID=3023084 RepID=UPI0030BB4202
MAERFRWTRRGYTAQLELPEVRLLRGLVRDVVALLEGRRADVRPAEADPAEAPAAEDGVDTPEDPRRRRRPCPPRRTRAPWLGWTRPTPRSGGWSPGCT